MTHTKGPWKINWEGEIGHALSYEITGEARETYWIAQVLRFPKDDDNRKMNQECTANARLIAKAPEMLEALQIIGEALQKGKIDGRSRPFGTNMTFQRLISSLLSEIEKEV